MDYYVLMVGMGYLSFCLKGSSRHNLQTLPKITGPTFVVFETRDSTVSLWDQGLEGVNPKGSGVAIE
jgi:hypothetical protein